MYDDNHEESLRTIKTILEKKFENLYVLIDHTVVLNSYSLIPLELHENLEHIDKLLQVLQENHLELLILIDSSDQNKLYLKFVPELFCVHRNNSRVYCHIIYHIAVLIVLSVYLFYMYLLFYQ